ncbi:ZEB2-regulated ABC transporter 1 [Lasiodiplodia hormozganensis]|uniref:ZEB2-regulated ABC transporter 1 n=1 Tax=Lasiodiplodia hormozganensis TaxID=869390 RepID=A0AA40CI26_9PEZI|nr:ZEB2-regulated ABC transporter 1 [Lasiodiplodia hormozganensis]
MHHQYRGEAIYTAENDIHFPMLTVGETLSFAARARAPSKLPGGISSSVYTQNIRDATMAMYGILHTVNTRVGNDFIRGVSGGERKRVSIAEATLGRSPLQCWDNSTRGLDSANAIEFCKTLKQSTELAESTAMVAIYQAPQKAYDLFDKVTVLYEGRQIYFGRVDEAKQYFQDLGFECPDRQTTPDFLTSMTSPAERIIRPGYENLAPRTADEFARRWKASQARMELLEDIENYNRRYPIGGEDSAKFSESFRAQQSRGQRSHSPYVLSYSQQVRLCLWRGYRRLLGDPSLSLTQLVSNISLALCLGSVFYNMKADTNSFYGRGGVIFFALLLNAFGSALEILTLYEQRPIVEKHARYAYYHPSAEAISSMLMDLPYKVVNSILFNLIIYFLPHLRREPGAFFFFLFVSFVSTLAMSSIFRLIASLSRTLPQAMVPTAVLIYGLVMYTGFSIPISYMRGWSRWINYVNPIAYSFEALMVNEFHGRNFSCAAFVPSGPGYSGLAPDQRVCSAIGSVPMSQTVNGDAYTVSSFQYQNGHKWRNVGIMFGFLVGLTILYLVAAELVSEKKGKGEVLLFLRSKVPARSGGRDVEGGAGAAEKPLAAAVRPSDAPPSIEKHQDVFHWEDVCYDIKIKNEERRILDHVDGWVKPGTLTALMGASGAGKTTLLDVLATRVTMGVVTGDMLVNGQPRDASFQRKTGYVQQQDIHLASSTIREALEFSALLRQGEHIPRAEKLAYVDEVLKLLDMEEYADAIIGVPGEGLNIEQRKRLTIGIELAARPQLLLFLDEPTSGLDSQTSWAICDLMQKLTNNGQAILCTIHQPSAMLFQRFDRLLLLAKGGRTVYFGEVGKGASTLIEYLERNGASPCPPGENPAEWMLHVIGAAPGAHTTVDWPSVWRSSNEYLHVKQELQSLKDLAAVSIPTQVDDSQHSEYAVSFWAQYWQVQKRVAQQYWRSPVYIYSKLSLVVLSGLFVGFSFYMAENTIQGLQNQMYSVLMSMLLFIQLSEQIAPVFVMHRSIFESRERPSKMYGWKVFILSNIGIEVCWNSLMAVLFFFCWYYPIGLYRNAELSDDTTLRGFKMFLFIWIYLLFTTTFTYLITAGLESVDTAGSITSMIFNLLLIFCGVLVRKDAMPGFWHFLYRVNPFTYLVSGILSTGIARADVSCAANEYVSFAPPANQTCGQYMESYIARNGGYLLDPAATDACRFCRLAGTDAYLQNVDAPYGETWRNFGLMWVYVGVNVVGAMALYWVMRVPKRGRTKE